MLMLNRIARAPGSHAPGSRALKTAFAAFALFAMACFPAAAQKLDTFAYDFENGDRQGWGPRGTVAIAITDKAAHSGKFGLAATGRGETWSGPNIQLATALKTGGTYEISGWVRLAKAPAEASSVKLTMEEKPAKGGTNWKTVGEAKISDTGWVQIKGSYSITAPMTDLSLYAESSAISDDLYLDDLAIVMTSAAAGPVEAQPAIQADLKPIKDKFAGAFSIGAAVTPNNISGVTGDMLLKHFNSIVAENAMKSMYIHPTEASYYWDEADRIVAFAKKNGMELRYHTLLWHEQCAPWFFVDAAGKDMTLETDPAKKKANKALLLKRLDSHVKTIVSRYKNDIRSWDVVNEVIDAKESDGLRRSKWYQVAGEDFIATAFRAARAAGGSGIKLYINDYSTEDPAKRDALLTLVKKLIAKGVPIDGVGHQCHVSVDFPAVSLIGESIRSVAELGLDNQVTELDVSVYADNVTSHATVPADLIARQGYRFKELFEEFSKYKDSISNVTFWGIADNASWLHDRPIPRRDAPFAFDEKYQAKPAYWGMINPAKLPKAPEPPKPLAPPKVAEAKYGTPAIDGKIESAWNKAKKIDVKIAAVGKPAATGTARVLWDENFLYVLVEVTDPVLDNKAKNDYEKDSVELYLDENNGKSPSYQADDGQFRVTFEGVPSFGSNGADDRFASSVARVKGGYLVEAAIPFRSITGTNGLVLGFDAQINDADGTGTRAGVSKWNDPTDNSWQSALNWGTVKLVK